MSQANNKIPITPEMAQALTRASRDVETRRIEGLVLTPIADHCQRVAEAFKTAEANLKALFGACGAGEGNWQITTLEGKPHLVRIEGDEP